MRLLVSSSKSGTCYLLWIAAYLKPVHSNISVVTIEKGHLERTRLTRVQVSAIDVSKTTPNDDAGRDRIKTVVDAFASGQHLVKVETPVFQLGDRIYTIDHPLTSAAHSAKVESGVNPAALRSGDTFRLVPGSDAGVTTAKLVDWVPGII